MEREDYFSFSFKRDKDVEEGRAKIETHYPYLTNLEGVVESVLLAPSGLGNDFHISREESQQTNDQKECPTVEWEKITYFLKRQGVPHHYLRVEMHASFGSTYDGSKDWMESFMVECFLYINIPLAKTVFGKLKQHYARFWAQPNQPQD